MDFSNNKLLLEKIQQTDFSKHLTTNGVLKKGTPSLIRRYWFINKCFDKFGLESYDFSLLEFSSTKEYMKLECPIHGVFSTLPTNFLSNTYGCPKKDAENRLEGIPHMYLMKPVTTPQLKDAIQTLMVEAHLGK
jgi:hypothetical protein